MSAETRATCTKPYAAGAPMASCEAPLTDRVGGASPITLVIDVGTSSMRGILYDAAGCTLASHQVRYRPRYKAPGQVEQPASDFSGALVEICASIASSARETNNPVDLVALTAQRSSVTAVDASGEALVDFLMWQDTRTASICERLLPHAAHVFELSGTRVNTVFSGGKMAWIRENLPEVYVRAERICNIPEYLMHLMCGTWRTDHTYGSRSNLMNIRTREWDEDLLGLFGVDREKLCELVEPGSVTGTLTSSFAKATGLLAGTPVISAGGDQQCGSVGQGVTDAGRFSVVCGTGAFLETTCSEVPKNLRDDVIVNAACLAGRYTLEANVPTCCSAFDWFRREFYPADLGFDELGTRLECAYAAGVHAAVEPHFQGRGTPAWDPSARASFSNISLSTTRDELLCALLLGIFREVKLNLDSFARYVPLAEGFVSGGLTQTRVVNQMLADALGMPLTRLDDAESTARGALISALVGQGVYASAAEAFDAICGDIEREEYTPARQSACGRVSHVLAPDPV